MKCVFPLIADADKIYPNDKLRTNTFNQNIRILAQSFSTHYDRGEKKYQNLFRSNSYFLRYKLFIDQPFAFHHEQIQSISAENEKIIYTLNRRKNNNFFFAFIRNVIMFEIHPVVRIYWKNFSMYFYNTVN